MRSLLLTALALSLMSPPGGAAQDEATANWPQWRGPEGTGVRSRRRPAGRMERDSQRGLENGDTGPRAQQSDRVGRSRLPSHGDRYRRRRRSIRAPAAPRQAWTAPSRARARECARVHRAGAGYGLWRDRLAAHRERSSAGRRHPSGRKLGQHVRRHRRRAADRVVRIGGPLQLLPRGKAGMVDRSRRHDDAQRFRRGELAGNPRRSRRGDLGSRRRLVHRRARQAERRGAVAARSG